MFVLLSGVMCGFSRSNIRRGLVCLALAFAVTFGTVIGSKWFGRIEIYFGILHLLGFSMLFCGLFDFILKKINKWLGFILNAVLFFVLYGIPPHQTDLLGIREIIPTAWNNLTWLFPFGITTDEFYSADYFPLIPWLFLFVCGYYLYRFNVIQNNEKLFAPKRIKPLGFLGRHALIIYIVHQPLIYILAYPFI